MRLTTVLLIASLIQVSAATFGQKITLDQKDAPLKTLFKEIRKQSGYNILYDNNIISTDVRSSLKVSNASIDEALNTLLTNLPYNYEIKDKLIIITKKRTPSFPDKANGLISTHVARIDVSGKVADENGQPIGGASVVVKSTGKGVITAADGNFLLNNVEEGATLVVKFIGYNEKEFVAAKEVGIVRMKMATNELDAVQIQAYGVTSKRLTTSNIATIRAEDIEKQPVSNPLLALQGKVAGLMITPASGLAGDRVDVRIQGINSIRGGNQPFYVVDGVPYNSTLIQPNENVNSVWRQQSGDIPLGEGNTGGSPLNYINSADIESIEILKDADATAIYGSRAANGAIIITTKRGKPGPLHFETNLRSGYTEMSRPLNYMGLQEYIEMRLEAKRNDNQTVFARDYDINGFWGDKVSNDLENYFLDNKVSYHDFQASVNGGNGTTNFRLNLGYIKQNSIYGKDNNEQKVSIGLNLNSTSANRRFKVDFNVNGMLDYNRMPVEDLTGTILRLSPNVPSFNNDDGTLNWALDDSGIATWNNPLAILEQKNISKINNMTSNLKLAYEFAQGFKLSSSFGYSRMDMDATRTNPLSALQPISQNPGRRFGNFSNTYSSNYSIEPQLSYSGRLFGLKTDWLVGGSIQQSSNLGKGISANTASSDDLLDNISAYTTLSPTGNVSNIYRYNALFGRLTINHLDKILVNLTARRDGSSRFGPENRFENFGAIGIGWIFTQLEWLKNRDLILSFGKLRASFGTTGNDQIGDYTFLDLYNSYNLEIAYQDLALLSQSGGYNPNLEWERTNKINLGVDLGFFRDKVSFTANYALNRSSNLLQRSSLPMSASITNSIWINFPGTVENRNLEVSLSSENFRSRTLRWSSTLNFTRARNELLSIGDLSKLVTGADNLLVGHSIKGVRTYQYAGVDPLTGNFRFMDRNGNPVTAYNRTEDRTGFVDLTPRFYGGLLNSFRWNGLNLDIQFNAVRQMSSSYLSIVNSSNAGVEVQNEPTTNLKRWHKPGDVAVLKRFGRAESATISLTNQGYEDATYLRLNMVALGWAVPESWLKSLKLSRANLGVQAQNLWTITNYSGLDPETGSVALPQPRTVVLNLSLGF